MLKHHWKFISLSVVITLMGVFFIFIIYANLVIIKKSDKIVFPADVPTSTVGLIFGGGLNADGTPNEMLTDRIVEGVALYKTGKVSILMMTGDDGKRYQNEVDAMKKAAMSFGVPENKIILDRHGYRTYESCYREANIFGFTEVIAVSQAFHLPRIIYLCENFGIKTIGVAADLHSYGGDLAWMKFREVGARLKAWWQIKITHPLPMVLE
ncbi:MAG: ElyC/SanA/YdcF family protein [Patescibacteria group bacterium]|jgi:vancomycin permeability regulator SanA